MQTLQAQEQQTLQGQQTLQFRYQQLAAKLRCLSCPNVNILESQSETALQLRQELWQLLQANKTDAEIITVLRMEHGPEVWYQPPWQLGTCWLWLLPALLVVVAGRYFYKLLKVG